MPKFLSLNRAPRATQKLDNRWATGGFAKDERGKTVKRYLSERSFAFTSVGDAQQQTQYPTQENESLESTGEKSLLLPTGF